MSNLKKRQTTAREIAGKIVHDILSSDAFSNHRLSEVLEKSQLETRDKNFCTELVYGTLRWATPLESSLRSALDKPGKIPPRVLAHCLVAAYQLQHLSDTIPAHAAVNEAVSLVRHLAPGLAGLANAILRKLGSSKDQMLVFSKASSADIASAYSLPSDLVKSIHEQVQGEAEAAIKSFNDRPRTYFRAFDSGPDSGLGLVPHLFVPGAYYASGSGELSKLISENKLVVQDPASQLAALLLNPSTDARVIDMCAAPGMKSLILKSLVGAKGLVVANELNPAKKARIIENMKRLEFPLEIQISDARKLSQTSKAKFDFVMLDSPCSGLGTIRRHPEIRYRYTQERVQEITALQRELLTSASEILKPGGILVYSVCSPLLAEGRDQIDWFLAHHVGFEVEDPRSVCPWMPEDSVTKEKYVTLWPHRHDSDAFFAARLIKR